MQNKKIDIVIFRGAPGSGKSQTAKSLSRFYPKGARIEVDTIRHMVISVDWKNQQEHINMLQVSIGMVSDFLKLGFNPVIVVDTFSGDKINKYLENLLKLDANLSVKIVGLYTTDEELKRRLEIRPDDEFRDFAICKKLNSDVRKKKYEDEFQINTTGLTSNQTAEIIYGNLQAGNPIRN